MSAASAVIAIAACLALVALAMVVCGSVPRRGGWVAWLVWAAIGSGALTMIGAAPVLPLPASVLLLILAAMLWSRLSRIVWAAERGELW